MASNFGGSVRGRTRLSLLFWYFALEIWYLRVASLEGTTSYERYKSFSAQLRSDVESLGTVRDVTSLLCNQVSLPWLVKSRRSLYCSACHFLSSWCNCTFSPGERLRDICIWIDGASDDGGCDAIAWSVISLRRSRHLVLTANFVGSLYFL